MRIMLFSLLAVVALLLVPAGASAEAAALKDCGQVNTNNGGKARSIQATGGTPCRAARRVARRAKGRRYTALGYTCYKPIRVPGEFNKLYGCAKPGTSRGIGFFYRGPRR
jgi:hypothetical protein